MDASGAPSTGAYCGPMDDVRGVLFDFGNTLFAHASLPHTVEQCCRRLGAATTAEWAAAAAARIEAAAHTPDEVALGRDLDAAVWRARWHVLYAVADGEVPGLGAAIYSAMHDPLQWVPYARTATTLRTLVAAGVPVALVSNTGWDVRAVLAAHGLLGEIRSVVLSCEAGLVKPSAAIFELACSQLGVAPSEALMVGDDVVADGGAARAGLRTLLLPVGAPGVDNGLDAVTRIVVPSPAATPTVG